MSANMNFDTIIHCINVSHNIMSKNYIIVKNLSLTNDDANQE